MYGWSGTTVGKAVCDGVAEEVGTRIVPVVLKANIGSIMMTVDVETIPQMESVLSKIRYRSTWMIDTGEVKM